MDDNDELLFPRYDYCGEEPPSEEYGNVQLEIKTPRYTPVYRFQDPPLMSHQKEASTSIADGIEQGPGVPNKNSHCRNCSSPSTLRCVTPMETIKEEDDGVSSGLDTAAHSPSDSRSSTPSSETTQIVRNSSSDITEEVLRIVLDVAGNEEDRRDFLAETKALEDYYTGLDVSDMSPRSLDKILTTLKQRRAVRGLIATNDEKLNFPLECLSPSKKAIKTEESEKDEATLQENKKEGVAGPVVECFADSDEAATQKADFSESNRIVDDSDELELEGDDDEVSSTIINTDEADLHPRLETRERVKMTAIDEDNLPTIEDGNTAVIKDHLTFLHSDTVSSTYGEVEAPAEADPVMSAVPMEEASSPQDDEIVGEKGEEPLQKVDDKSTNHDCQESSSLEDNQVLTEDFLALEPATTKSRSWIPQNPIRRCFYGSLIFGVKGTKRIVDGIANLLRKN